MFNAKFSSADERVFLCGASSKDAGASITGILDVTDIHYDKKIRLMRTATNPKTVLLV